MRSGLAVLLAVHGVAHLPGFLSSWKLAELKELPYKTAIFAGRIEIGDVGTRALGLLWIATAGGLLISALGIATTAGWGMRLTALILTVSFLMCLTGWPEARIGLLANVLLGVALVLLKG